MKKIAKALFVACFLLMAASCGTVDEYVLINDIEDKGTYQMQPMPELRVKRGDDLRIIVTHKMPQIAEMFNNKINSLNNGESLTTFTVNGDGYINFPFIDTLHVEGLTCSEIEQLITKRIADAGLANGASVNVKITNFKVTVIGEGATGLYHFDDGRATIFDLIAEANILQNQNNNYNGGVGIRRDKILIMREDGGEVKSEYISLLSKDILYSPYFYLQQNDVVYVWPSQSAIRSSNRIVDFWLGRLSIVTTAVSVVTLVTSLFVNKKQ